MKTVESGEMYGFKIINIFPEDCTDDEWVDFADTMTEILKEKDTDNTVSAFSGRLV